MAWGAGSAWGGYTAPFDSGTPDPVPPHITNISPPVGNAIATTQVISFDITDDVNLVSVIVMASFADGSVDVVHDNDGFRGFYVGLPNTRVPIANGWRYTILRRGGWPSALATIEYVPIDSSGNLGIVA